MRRFARLGVAWTVVVGVGVEVLGGRMERLSSRFFNVTERRELLNTCAWSFWAASCAAEEVENNTCAELKLKLKKIHQRIPFRYEPAARLTCADIITHWPIEFLSPVVLSDFLP
jgi:hypothetical protein